jgi:hypothetical protein
MRKSLRSAQAEAQSSATRKAISQRLFNVCDPAALILEGETQSTPVALLQTFEKQAAAPAMNDCITSQFACRGDDFCLVDKIEPGFNRPRAYRLANEDDILRRT